jgi:hypothetical protein
MIMRTCIVLILTLLMPPLAHAQVRTLVCASSSGTHLFQIDFVRQVTCVQDGGLTSCAGRYPVQISERYIIMQLGGPVSIDRKTGVVLWVDGSQGTCHGDALGN